MYDSFGIGTVIGGVDDRCLSLWLSCAVGPAMVLIGCMPWNACIGLNGIIGNGGMELFMKNCGFIKGMPVVASF